MPRITRATLRSNAALADSDLLSPSTPRKQRAPLGEIAGNVEEDSRIARSSGQMTTARKKGPVKLKKGKAEKKVKAAVLEFSENSENSEEILEDDNQMATSSAVEEACDDLMKHSSSGNFRTWL